MWEKGQVRGTGDPEKWAKRDEQRVSANSTYARFARWGWSEGKRKPERWPREEA